MIGPRVQLPLLHPDRAFQDHIAHPPYSSSSPARSGIIQYSARLATRDSRPSLRFLLSRATCILSFDAILVLLLPRRKLRVPASHPTPGFHRPQLSYSHSPIPYGTGRHSAPTNRAPFNTLLLHFRYETAHLLRPYSKPVLLRQSYFTPSHPAAVYCCSSTVLNQTHHLPRNHPNHDCDSHRSGGVNVIISLHALLRGRGGFPSGGPVVQPSSSNRPCAVKGRQHGNDRYTPVGQRFPYQQATADQEESKRCRRRRQTQADTHWLLDLQGAPSEVR